MFRVDAAVIRDILLTPFVHVQVTNFTLQSLPYQPVKQRTAVVAEREPFIIMYDESMRNIHVESCRLGARLERLN